MPSSATAAITAYVDQDTSQLVVQGTDGDDHIHLSGDADSDDILVSGSSFGDVEPGWGCYEEVHQVYCGRDLAPWDFTIYVDGGGGNDEILRDYQIVGGPNYDPAVLDGGPGADFIGGSAGDDVIVGGLGDDIVDGQRGDDLVIGGPLALGIGETAGTDHVYGGWGDDLVDDGDDDSMEVDADRLDGGSCDPDIEGYGRPCRDEGPNADDFDLVDWSLRTGSVSVDLGATGATQGATGEHETLVNLNGAYTGDGDDELAGSAADELFDGGLGADVIDGRGGTDAASYADRTEAVDVNLASAAAVQGAAGEGDRLVSIESVVGGDGGDHLRGSAAQNALAGGPGNDLIRSDGDQGAVDGIWCDEGDDSLTRDVDDVAEDCEEIEVSEHATGPQPSAPKPRVVVAPNVPAPPQRPGFAGGRTASARVGGGGAFKLLGQRVSCPAGATRCRVTATLHGKRGTLGTRRLTLSPGDMWTIKLKLGKPARRLLHRRRLHATLDLTVKSGAVTVHRRVKVTLRSR